MDDGHLHMDGHAPFFKGAFAAFIPCRFFLKDFTEIIEITGLCRITRAEYKACQGNQYQTRGHVALFTANTITISPGKYDVGDQTTPSFPRLGLITGDGESNHCRLPYAQDICYDKYHAVAGIDPFLYVLAIVLLTMKPRGLRPGVPWC